MTKKLVGLLLILSSLTGISSAYAKTTAFELEEKAESGTLYPVESLISTGKYEGQSYVSISNKVGHSETVQSQPDFIPVSNPITEWSYGRGVGTIPNSCPSGFDAAGLLCYRHCPEGYDTVAGVCWQKCPAGYTDHGATCTMWKWWPETIGKHSFMQEIKGMSCSADKVNDAGLCYEPCAATFVGVGPLCFGLFGDADDQQHIRHEAGEQQDGFASAQAPGIVLDGDQLPSLKTDIAFNPIVCGIDRTGIDDQINNGTDQLLDPVDLGAWINASLAGTVLLDFDFDAQCVDQEDAFIGTLSFNPSVAAKVSTHMFDPALHNLAGVDLGVMSVSVYELIPFRVYGTVGANLGINASVTSRVDKNLPPLIVDGVQHAHSTSLEIHPEQDLWLSIDAYLRITSLFNFIPDLVQLGAELNVHVLETMLPYRLEEGVRDYAGALEVYHQEHLSGTVAAGRGYIDTYLRILGQESETFGNDADMDWPGESVTEVFIDEQTSNIIEM
ncbi:hypothetical protein TDB9533_00007 [Thalassocella blandensis]|nr:hypothetical protein TDB9533_00007 [Thalassocella blandensis]